MTQNSLQIEDADEVVDVTGQVCAMPILSAAEALQQADDGDLLAVETGKPEHERDDVEDWVTRLDGASFVDTRLADDGLIVDTRSTTRRPTRTTTTGTSHWSETNDMTPTTDRARRAHRVVSTRRPGIELGRAECTCEDDSPQQRAP